jgi:predicted acylesterase/phospholipase RssA
LLALSPGLEAAAFAASLEAALAPFGRCRRLDSGAVDAYFGAAGMAQAGREDPRGERLDSWLDEQEAASDFLLLVADSGPSHWTARCLRRVDRVLLLADAEGEAAPGAVERWLAESGLGGDPAQRALVLLHRAGTERPRGTAAWLQAHPAAWHLHLRGASAGDLDRLARILAGRAVGLVLGGGGARAFAHVGAIRALREAGVPIDHVGGTSMGAVIGALAAMELPVATMRRLLRWAFVESGAAQEYTLPLVSILRGERARRVMEEAYGPWRLEDLWLGLFTVAANLSRSELVVHESGPLDHAVRASMALPGILPPVLASGELLVDGGAVNNMPADLMRSRCSGATVVVDGGGRPQLAAAGETLPGPLAILAGRFRPGHRPPPLIGEILQAAGTLSANRVAAEHAHQADFMLRLPVEAYRLLQFDALDDIIATGYTHARDQVAEWCASGALGPLGARPPGRSA